MEDDQQHAEPMDLDDGAATGEAWSWRRSPTGAQWQVLLIGGIALGGIVCMCWLVLLLILRQR